ncbi:hypothetical protein HUE58_02810 [Candidatus Ruthia endofausta]|uniref:Uncharacterized protein n=1 Tax=Candidatus Ruthia endofausta TaxID=2738852 RepID=A0A6N0HP61_9GAMM|nr:hypothetical protein [Candidatus Ruthia endofausta]QKQ24103.1 hypothetical protein HUE58_02810 [Candidatus Ruthia endofausta]
MLENLQGHVILGSNYWKEQGATLIAHTKAYKEIQHRSEDIYAPVLRTQEDKMILNMGGITIDCCSLVPLICLMISNFGCQDDGGLLDAY